VAAHAGPRIPTSSVIFAVAICGAALAGGVMGRSMQLGLAVTAALCFTPLVLMNLPMGVVLWIPFASLIAVPALDVGPTLLGLMVLFAWFGALATRRPSVQTLALRHRRLLTLVAVLVLWVLISMAWARRSAVGTDAFFGWLAGGTIMLVVTTTIGDRRHVRLAAAAFVLGVVVSVVIGLLGAVRPGDASRLAGGSGDPNFLAAGIVPAIALAAGLAAGSRRLLVHVAMLLAIAALTVGLVAAESRGGFVAAGVAIGAALLLARRGRAWLIVLLLGIVGVGAARFSVDPTAWQRVTRFDSTGRTEIWKAAWQMWQDHPVEGVGLRGFVDNAADYVRDLGPLQYANFLVERPKFVHNSYLEMLVETGLVGLALFIAVILGSLGCAWRAGRHFDRTGDAPMATLSRAAMVSVLAMLAADYFISGTTDRRLWVLLALGPALLAATGSAESRRRVSGSIEAPR
jgi:O-antigen ligase